jgi:hypothetical protein
LEKIRESKKDILLDPEVEEVLSEPTQANLL